MIKKTSYILLFLSITLLVFSSCNKPSVSIQRDIIIGQIVEFYIPPINTITADTTLGDILFSSNLGEEIKTQTAQQFDASNIRNIKVIGFKMDLTEPVDSATLDSNNLGNLQNLAIEISGNDKSTPLASVTENSAHESINLVANAAAVDLKTILTAASLKYVIRTRAIRATKVRLKVKATAVYTITVGR